MKKRERDSGMELLRIFAMLLVICVHMFSYGGFYTAAKAVGGHVHSTALLMKLPGSVIAVLDGGGLSFRFDPRKKKIRKTEQ